MLSTLLHVHVALHMYLLTIDLQSEGTLHIAYQLISSRACTHTRYTHILHLWMYVYTMYPQHQHYAMHTISPVMQCSQHCLPCCPITHGQQCACATVTCMYVLKHIATYPHTPLSATRAHTLTTTGLLQQLMPCTHTHHNCKEKRKGLEEGGPFLFAAYPRLVSTVLYTLQCMYLTHLVLLPSPYLFPYIRPPPPPLHLNIVVCLL